MALARDGDPEPIHLQETEASFSVAWMGQYRIEGPAFVYSDRDSHGVTASSAMPQTRSLKRADLNFKSCLDRYL